MSLLFVLCLSAWLIRHPYNRNMARLTLQIIIIIISFVRFLTFGFCWPLCAFIKITFTHYTLWAIKSSQLVFVCSYIQKQVGSFSIIIIIIIKGIYIAQVRKGHKWLTDCLICSTNCPALMVSGPTRPAPDDSLVYTRSSPDFCKPVPKIGFNGTRGRACADPTSCRHLCCGRGHVVRTRTFVDTRCHCQFKYCCYVTCQSCVRTVREFVCL